MYSGGASQIFSHTITQATIMHPSFKTGVSVGLVLLRSLRQNRDGIKAGFGNKIGTYYFELCTFLQAL